MAAKKFDETIFSLSKQDKDEDYYQHYAICLTTDKVTTKAHGFGQALKLARMRQGLNQKELAQKLDCDASFISRLESSQRLPSVDTLKTLSCALGISIDELVSYLDVE